MMVPGTARDAASTAVHLRRELVARGWTDRMLSQAVRSGPYIVLESLTHNTVILKITNKKFYLFSTIYMIEHKTMIFFL